MNPLRQVSIRTRLIGAMGLIVALFAGCAAYWLSEIRGMAELASGLYEHPYRVSRAAWRVELGILRMHRGMKDFTLSETDAGRNDALEIVNTEEQEVYRTLDNAHAWMTDEEGKRLVEETRTLFAGWKPIRMDVQRLVFKGRKDDAARMTRREGADYVARLERHVGRLNQFARLKADAVIDEVGRAQSRILRQAVLAVLGATLLCLGVGYGLVQSIVPDILSLRDTMSGIATTGTLAQTHIEGKNEIAEMGRYFNGLIQTLRGQLWLGAGQTGLGDVLISPADREGLGEGVVNFVARYVDACSAALYTSNEASASCRLQASYAFVEESHFRREYRLGEDVVGQVAVDRKPILLRNVPAVPPSADATEPPRESSLTVYAVPLVYGNRLYGVLAVSLFETLDSTKKSFLDVAAQSISTALCAAAQKKRIEELLEATRESKGVCVPFDG